MSKNLTRQTFAVIFAAMIIHIAGYGLLALDENRPGILTVTVWFMVVMFGMMGMITSRNYVVETAANIMYQAGSYFLFVAFKGEPVEWGWDDHLTQFFILSNTFMISYLLNKFKHG